MSTTDSSLSYYLLGSAAFIHFPCRGVSAIDRSAAMVCCPLSDQGSDEQAVETETYKSYAVGSFPEFNSLVLNLKDKFYLTGE
ncbi:hypothetical protein KKI24_21600 [bacterium]|nr:hypothetical protein [bacterium]